ncbi:MAG TPA: GNAT family N-acetyltransferase [Steroidobacter sp.]|jgi:GNAT superfamily N-acetyltransferase|nr:GNAT family N-acetyltransferase [Steroidobacteraceae bacterium]HLS80414.1 GNAT family N-acetyltransferase [Steroidobacter sp.]
MSAPIHFVPITTDPQVETTASLAREIWGEFYAPLIGRAQVDYMLGSFQSPAAIRAQINEGYEYFLVQRGEQPVGYFAVRVQAAQQALFVSKFYVHQRARGSGTGRACMEFIERLARSRDLALLWLTVYKGNPSVRAYERLGFRIAADVVTDIGGGFVMDDFRMEKPLI